MKKLIFTLFVLISINCRAEWKEAEGSFPGAGTLPFATHDGYYLLPNLSDDGAAINYDIKTNSIQEFNTSTQMNFLYSGTKFNNYTLITTLDANAWISGIYKYRSMNDVEEIFILPNGGLYYSYPVNDSLYFINYTINGTQLDMKYGILNANTKKVVKSAINDIENLGVMGIFRKFHKANDSTYYLLMANGLFVKSTDSCKTFKNVLQDSLKFKDILFDTLGTFLLTTSTCYNFDEKKLSITELVNNSQLTDRIFYRFTKANGKLLFLASDNSNTFTELYFYDGHKLQSEFYLDKFCYNIFCEDDKKVIISGATVCYNDYSTTSVSRETQISESLKLTQNEDYIKISSNPGDQINIYDYTGSQIYTAASDGELIYSDYKNLPTGVYFISATSAKGVSYGKFVK